MLSFVIPAHNEESVLAETLATLSSSARECGARFEILVVDDASTDRTAEIARAAGATVVAVALRKISAVRNAGARAAAGEWLIFVDADTLVPAATLRLTIAAFDAGAVGGGAAVVTEPGSPWWLRVTLAAVVWSFRRIRWAAGCYLFARRADFEAVGGFDENYYASEEIHLSRALKTRGRFVIVDHPVVTSARKARLFGAGDFARVLVRFAFLGTRAVKRREGLDLWYDGQREPKPPDRFVRASPH